MTSWMNWMKSIDERIDDVCKSSRESTVYPGIIFTLHRFPSRPWVLFYRWNVSPQRRAQKSSALSSALPVRSSRMKRRKKLEGLAACVPIDLMSLVLPHLCSGPNIANIAVTASRWHTDDSVYTWHDLSRAC